MAAASAGTLPVQGASVPLPGPSLAQQQPSQQQQHSHQVQQQTPLHRHQQQHLSTFQSGASVEGLVVSQHHQSQSIYHHQQQASVVAPNLVSGWRRLVTNGDIVYISPSGEALRTIGQIKDYLLSSGTCKCGLPCPFRPELFFNFNSQIPNSLLPTASSDRSASSTCLHQQRLLEKTKTILAKDVTIKRRKLAQGEWQGTTSTSLQHLSQDESMVKQRHIVTKFGSNQGHQLYHHNAPNYVTHPLQQPPQQQQHQVVNNLVVGQSITAGSLPNQTVNIVTGNLGQQQQQHLQSQQSQQHPGSSSQGGGVNRQPTTASTFQTVPCSTVNSSNNLISGNNVIQSGNNVRTNLSGSSGSSSNSTSNVNQIIGLNPTISNISSNNSNSHTNANHNNVVIESVNHHHQQQHHHHAAQLAGGSLQGQQQQQQHHMQHQAASSVLYQQSQHPTRISSGTGSLMVTSYATTIAGGSSLKPSNAITTTSTFSNLQLSKSPPWRRNSSAMHHQQQQQQQQQNQIQVSYERVPPLPQQHLVSQPPPWQEENQKRIMKVRSSPSMINPVTKKRPNFKDDPTGYLDHQTAILHSSILGVPSPDLVDNAAEQATNRISEQEYQVGVKAKPKQQMVQSQRPKANPTIIEMGNFTIGGQTVTHLPNGMVQVQQNCDVLQAQQLPIVRSNTSTTPVTQTVTKQSDKGGQQPMLVQASQESPVSSSTAFTEKRPSSRSDAGLKGPVQGGTISTSNDSPASFSASPLSCASPSQSPDLQINRNASTPSTSVQKTYAKVVHKNPVQPQKISGKPTIMQQKLVMENQMKINEIPNQNPIIITQVSTEQAQHTSNVVSVQSHQQQQQQHHQIFVTDANGQTQQRLQPIVQNCIPMGTNISSLPGSQFVMTTSGQIIVVPPKTTLSSANANGLITTASNQNILISNGSHHTNTGNVIIQNSPHQGQIINTINGNAIVSGNLDLTDQSGRNVVIPGAQNATTIQIANPSGNSVIINQQPQNGAAKIIGQSSLLGTSHHHHHHQQHHHHHQNQILTTNNGTVTVLNTMPSGFVIQPTGTNQIIQQHTQATATIDGQHVIGQLIDTGNGTQQFIQTTNLQQLGGNRVVITSPDNQLKRKTKKRKSSSGSSTPSLSPQNSPPILSPQQPQQPVIQITPTPQYSQSFQISPGIPQLSILPNGGNSTTTATVAKAITSNTGQPTHQQILLPNGQTILQPLNLIQQQVLVPAGLVMTPDNTLLQIQNMAPCSSILTPQGVMIRAQSPQNKSFLSPNSGQQFIVTNQASGQISPQQLGHIYSTPMGLMMPQHQQQSRTFVQQSTATIVQQPTTIVTSQHQQQHHHQQQVVETPDRHQGGHILQQQQQQQHHSLYSGSASPPDTTTHSPQSPERPESQRSGGSDSNMVQCVSSSEPDSVTIIPNEQTAESPSSVLDYKRQQIGSRNKEVVKIRRVHQTSVPNQQQPSSYQRSVSASYSSSGMVVSATSSGMNNGGTSKTGATMRPDSRESSSSGGGGGGVVAGSSGNSNSGSLQRAKFAVGELVWGAAKGHPAWPGKIVPGPSSTPLTGEELNTMTWVRWFGGRPIIELVPVDALKSLSEGLEAHHRAQKETRKSRKLNTQLERAIQEAMADLDTAETKPILQSSPSRGRPNKQQSELSSSGGSVVRKEKLKFNKSSRAFSSSQLEEFVSSSSSSSSKAVPIRSKPPIKIAPAGEKLLRNHQAAIVDK